MGYRQRHSIPDLGVGVGFRTPHYAKILDECPPMDWFEVISENFMVPGGKAIANLEKLSGVYPVVPHGVSLSVGQTEPFDRKYLERLKALIARVSPPWASDHFCWTGSAHANVHDLLPLPLTREVAKHVAERIRRVQDFLAVPFALENASPYLGFTSSTLPEWEFICDVAERADCGLLLDVNNVFVSAYNHGFDAAAYIDAVPADRVVQMHLAGHTDKGTYLLDTHSDHVRTEVWELYRRAVRRIGATSTLIEWDDDIPSWDLLSLEAATARRMREEVLSGAPDVTASRLVER
jgi:uncharacterized protein